MKDVQATGEASSHQKKKIRHFKPPKINADPQYWLCGRNFGLLATLTT
jgi:hypothetical protein